MDTQQYSLVFNPAPASGTISSGHPCGYRRLLSTPNMSWQSQPQVNQLAPSSADVLNSPHVSYATATAGVGAGDTHHYSPTSFILRPASDSFVSDGDYSSSSSTETPSSMSFESPSHIDSGSPVSSCRGTRRDTETSDNLEWQSFNDVSHLITFPSSIYIHRTSIQRPRSASWSLAGGDTEMNDNTAVHDSPEAIPRDPRSDVPSFPQSEPSGFPRYPIISHSRSTSDSCSTSLSTSGSNPRSASPATSISSVASGPWSTQGIRPPSGLSNDAMSPIQPIEGAAAALPVPHPPKHQKKRLTAADKRKICDYQKANPTSKQEEIANVFGVERSTVSKILKGKGKWLHAEPEDPVGCHVVKLRSERLFRRCMS